MNPTVRLKFLQDSVSVFLKSIPWKGKTKSKYKRLVHIVFAA